MAKLSSNLIITLHGVSVNMTPLGSGKRVVQTKSNINRVFNIIINNTLFGKQKIVKYTLYGDSGTVTVGRYQNSGAGTGTFDIKFLSQVGHPLPPAEFHAHFDHSEDMLLA